MHNTNSLIQSTHVILCTNAYNTLKHFHACTHKHTHKHTHTVTHTSSHSLSPQPAGPTQLGVFPIAQLIDFWGGWELGWGGQNPHIEK